MDKLKETLIHIRESYGDDAERFVEPIRNRVALGKVYGITLEMFEEMYMDVFGDVITEDCKMPYETLQLFLEAEEAVNFYVPENDCETEFLSEGSLFMNMENSDIVGTSNYDDIPLCQLLEVNDETI